MNRGIFLSMCPLYVFEIWCFRYSNIQSFLSKSRLSLCLFVLSIFKHLAKNYPSRYFFNVASLKIKSCCLYWSYHSVLRGKKKGIQRRVPKMWFYSISMPRTSTASGFQLFLSSNIKCLNIFRVWGKISFFFFFLLPQ